MRQRWRSNRTTCTGGINQNPETATPDQVEVGTNVYAPSGRVIVRPGYAGVGARYGGNLSPTTKRFARSINGTITGSTTTLALDGLTTTNNDWWAIGTDTLNVTAAILVNVTSANAALINYYPTYYNGSVWKYLAVGEAHSTPSGAVPGTHLANTGAVNTFSFAAPSDWTTIDLDSNGTALYWIKFSIYPGAVGTTSMTAGTTVSWTSTLVKDFSTSTVGFFAPQYASVKRFVHASYTTASSVLGIRQKDGPGFGGSYSTGTVTGSVNIDEAATVAIVPQFDEAYLAYGYRVARLAAYPTGNSTGSLATVSTADEDVGPKAPYDPAYIVSDTVWPKAKYMLFYKGRLWAAGLENDRFSVQWSAPAPHYKVWPSLNKEPLMEDDNSPITGLAALGQNVVVFKQDSIWVMVDAGINDFGLQEYAPQRIVAGVGCVSNASIKQIRGNLIFLAEDGVYAFDGTPNIQKISDPIGDEIEKINKSLRKRAVAAHWRTENLYMLAVNYHGAAAQDAVLVYDYVGGTWWKWTNIDARFWIEDEGANDQEKIFFADSKSRIYVLGSGQTDNGTAITSTVRTHRFGYRDGNTHRARSVNVWTTNKASSIGLEIIANDNDTGSSSTISTLDSREANWTDFNYGGVAGTADSYTPARRRKVRMDVREDGTWHQVEVVHNTKNQPFALEAIDLGTKSLGKR